MFFVSILMFCKISFQLIAGIDLPLLIRISPMLFCSCCLFFESETGFNAVVAGVFNLAANLPNLMHRCPNADKKIDFLKGREFMFTRSSLIQNDKARPLSLLTTQF